MMTTGEYKSNQPFEGWKAELCKNCHIKLIRTETETDSRHFLTLLQHAPALILTLNLPLTMTIKLHHYHDSDHDHDHVIDQDQIKSLKPSSSKSSGD